MRLPGAERAVVDDSKVRDYLLSPSHPTGRSKAKFFEGLGFQQENWSVLATALRSLAVAGVAKEGKPSGFGRKYEVRGMIEGRFGSAPVVAVWIILGGEDVPRLVTVYPGDD